MECKRCKAETDNLVWLKEAYEENGEHYMRSLRVCAGCAAESMADNE